jgi:glyoxylate/hydroxypyruvate reductase A
VLGLGVLGAQVAQALAALGCRCAATAAAEAARRHRDLRRRASQFDACIDGAKVLVNLLPSTPDTDAILSAHLRGSRRRVPGERRARRASGRSRPARRARERPHRGRHARRVPHEPLPADHPFWQAPRITITPHNAALTLRDEAVEQIAGKIRALERGEPIGGIVDRARGY